MRNLALYVEVQAYCLASQPGPLTGLPKALESLRRFDL